MILNIVTPVTRPENLKLIAQSIKKYAKPFFSEVIWHQCSDGEKAHEFSVDGIMLKISHVKNDKSIFGNAQRNLVLDDIKFGYVYFLDDDNLLHPLNFKKLWFDGNSYLIDQVYFDQRIRIAHTNGIGPGSIDMACFIVNRDEIGDTRFDVERYDADGLFFKKLFVDEGKLIIRTDMAKAYYNKLRVSS